MIIHLQMLAYNTSVSLRFEPYDHHFRYFITQGSQAYIGLKSCCDLGYSKTLNCFLLCSFCGLESQGAFLSIFYSFFVCIYPAFIPILGFFWWLMGCEKLNRRTCFECKVALGNIWGSLKLLLKHLLFLFYFFPSSIF